MSDRAAIAYIARDKLFPRQATGRWSAYASAATAIAKVDTGGARRGGIVHRLHSVCGLFPKNGQPARLAARFSCNSFSADAVLGLEADGRVTCERCDWKGVNDNGRVTVYFAERGGLVKIGCSSNVLLRVSGLQARLLAIEPGGFARERELHGLFAAERHGGEWFRRSPALQAHIESLTDAARVA